MATIKGNAAFRLNDWHLGSDGKVYEKGALVDAAIYHDYLLSCAAHWRVQPGDKVANAAQAERVEAHAAAFAKEWLK